MVFQHVKGVATGPNKRKTPTSGGSEKPRKALTSLKIEAELYFVSRKLWLTIEKQKTSCFSCHTSARSVFIRLYEEVLELTEVLRFDAINDLAVLKIEASTSNFLKIAPLQSFNQKDTIFTGGVLTISEDRFAKWVIGPFSNPLGLHFVFRLIPPLSRAIRAGF